MFVFWLFVILVISRFGLEGGIWVLIAPVSGHCLLVKWWSPRAKDRLRPLYDSFKINFPRRVDQSDCVGAQAYLCRYWACM